MNREIKFRAFEVATGKMFYDGGNEVQPSWILHNLDYPPYSPMYELMQYTGLKDKNGKECYEGDLVRRSEFNDVVDIVYREDWGAFAFHAKHASGGGEGWSHMHGGHSVHSWEIIGNIYESN